MNWSKVLVIATLSLIVVACSKVPISGRRQVHLLPESQMIGMSVTAYDDFLSQAQVVPDSDPTGDAVKTSGLSVGTGVANVGAGLVP